MKVSPELARSLFYTMLRIRRVELKIEDEYGFDEMKTPVHLCIGQEAVSTGVCAHLSKNDYISSNHRGHGHYLAKGGDLNAMVAELYCRSTGCSGGYGGSMHLIDLSVRHVGSSAILGGGIPIATGLGLSIKMKNEKAVSVCFFGDGAADEGVLYESVNFAMLKKLPVVFVLENNQYSVCSPLDARRPGTPLFHYLPSDRLLTRKAFGNDVLDVFEAAGECIRFAREGNGPAFIECETYRLRGHAGAGSDAHLGYRTKEEIQSWEARSPIDAFKLKLLDEGLATNEQIILMENEIDAQIKWAFDLAKAGPLPETAAVTKFVFKE
jgi:acetoin:2,6-dichlorophenolindophenol oxidoreductase subunit alpha